MLRLAKFIVGCVLLGACYTVFRKAPIGTDQQNFPFVWLWFWWALAVGSTGTAGFSLLYQAAFKYDKT